MLWCFGGGVWFICGIARTSDGFYASSETGKQQQHSAADAAYLFGCPQCHHPLTVVATKTISPRTTANATTTTTTTVDAATTTTISSDDDELRCTQPQCSAASSTSTKTTSRRSLLQLRARAEQFEAVAIEQVTAAAAGNDSKPAAAAVAADQQRTQAIRSLDLMRQCVSIRRRLYHRHSKVLRQVF